MGDLPNNLVQIQHIGARTRERMASDRDVAAFADCGLGLAGSSLARAGFTFFRPAPDMRQLLVCTGGRGEVWLDHRWRDLTAGEAYYTPAGVPHAYRAKARGLWSLSWLTYPAAAPRAPRFAPKAPLVLPLNPRPFALAVEGLCEAVAHGAPQSERELWTRLLHQHMQAALAPATAQDPRLAALWSAVDADLAHPWTLAELAQRAGLGRESLRRACLAETGRSPLREVAHRRLRRAADLLRHTPDKVAAIGQRVGFTDPFAFSVAFKRAWGRSPRAHRGEA